MVQVRPKKRVVDQPILLDVHQQPKVVVSSNLELLCFKESNKVGFTRRSLTIVACQLAAMVRHFQQARVSWIIHQENVTVLDLSDVAIEELANPYRLGKMPQYAERNQVPPRRTVLDTESEHAG